ncbi:MAG: glycoside hydrolase family 3 C-terminal domain-containing protein [Oscillospiraceae bacterium]|nr:glycoside hydrolase family 3 C-terminal domain-containing protein [Oscillospiraceae bacterium]
MSFSEKLKALGIRLVHTLAQDQGHHNPIKTITPGMPPLLRRCAAEGAVLLENRVLPLPENAVVSVFGRVQLDYFCTGYGSGGDVNTPYRINLLQGLRSCEALRVNESLAQVYETWVSQNPADHGAWGCWPRSHPEMPVSEMLAQQARQHSDYAVVVIGRSSGEDRENVLEPGSYYLTEREKQLLRAVTGAFSDTVLLLNIGSVMDLSFLEEFLPRLGAVMILWQGGMESGNAAADLLCGKQTPSGRLTDTVARRYGDYPSASGFGSKDRNCYTEDIYVGYRWFETFAKDRVLYPFGYGMSYTRFSMSWEKTAPLSYAVTVTNTGNYPGKETAMVYVEKPQGALGNPTRELAAFAKTGLLAPGESQTLELNLSLEQLSSFDDSGCTGCPNCYVLLPGSYEIYCGTDVRSALLTDTYEVGEQKLLSRLTEAAAPVTAFDRVENENGKPVYKAVLLRTADLKAAILSSLPPAIPQTGDRGLKLKDVQSGSASMEAFLAQLSMEELEAITRGGCRMDHPLGPKGNAGIFGGVTASLREKGIPPVVTTDGPSGIRLYDSCSLLPIGTLLACTFDTALVEKLFRKLGKEMKERGSDVLLAPGMNIHRNVLCGRNFEYYSEDPLLTGKVAAAAVRGLQSAGVAACPKHFACNNQEYNRNKNDSALSQRALREIYLKGFEICVKESSPKTLMTSYNKINGVWGHYHYELVQTVLRGEWGYKGTVLTDWWMQYAPSPEFPNLRDNAYRVRAGVDVLMPGNRRFGERSTKDSSLLKTYGKEEGITLGEIQRCAQRILQTILELKEL